MAFPIPASGRNETYPGEGQYLDVITVGDCTETNVKSQPGEVLVVRQSGNLLIGSVGPSSEMSSPPHLSLLRTWTRFSPSYLSI